MLLPMLVLAIFALPVFAADNAAAGNTTGTVVINISAKNIAFNMSTITVPAGAKVIINFDN